MKNLILIAILVLTTNTYAFENWKDSYKPLSNNNEICDIDKLDYCLENSESDGCYELSGCEEQFGDKELMELEESSSKICLQLYMPVECENSDGHLEIFSNECEANKRGYKTECRFTERL